MLYAVRDGNITLYTAAVLTCTLYTAAVLTCTLHTAAVLLLLTTINTPTDVNSCQLP